MPALPTGSSSAVRSPACMPSTCSREYPSMRHSALVHFDVETRGVQEEDAVGRLLDERAVELLLLAQGLLGGDAVAPQARSDSCHELVGVGPAS